MTTDLFLGGLATLSLAAIVIVLMTANGQKVSSGRKEGHASKREKPRDKDTER